MTAVYVLAEVGVAVALMVSAATKAADFRGFAQTVRDLWPAVSKASTPLAASAVAAEFLVGAAQLLRPSRGAASATIVVAALLVAANLWGGRLPARYAVPVLRCPD